MARLNLALELMPTVPNMFTRALKVGTPARVALGLIMFLAFVVFAVGAVYLFAVDHSKFPHPHGVVVTAVVLAGLAACSGFISIRLIHIRTPNDYIFRPAVSAKGAPLALSLLMVTGLIEVASGVLLDIPVLTVIGGVVMLAVTLLTPLVRRINRRLERMSSNCSSSGRESATADPRRST